MQVLSNVGGPGGAPTRPAGSLLVASVDVEWSKNYRITNGNRAFCYSIVWLAIPDRVWQPATLRGVLPFGYSAKIEWFPMEVLPANTYPFTAVCVTTYRDGKALRLSGWR